MRVEGQGMANDYFPAKSDAVSKPVVQRREKKVGLEQLNTGNNTKVGLEQLNTGNSTKVDSEKADSEKVNTTSNTRLEEIKDAIGVVNEALNLSSFHLEFRLYEDTDAYQVKVVDDQSGEIIKEIPPDYMLDLSKRVKEMINKAVGVLVDELI